ncbi:uncharacterized protein LOC144075494 [Stigmatopora argus]
MSHMDTHTWISSVSAYLLPVQSHCPYTRMHIATVCACLCEDKAQPVILNTHTSLSTMLSSESFHMAIREYSLKCLQWLHGSAACGNYSFNSTAHNQQIYETAAN